MSAHSRKRGRRSRPAAAPRTPSARSDPGPPAPSRSEERNAAVRATLTPLAPGEHPWPLRVATLLAVLIGVGNVIQAIVGTHLKVGGTRATLGSTVVFGLIMLVCAAGMWRQRYWAVLGFQVILAIIVVTFSLVLLTANDIVRAVIAVAVIAAGGYLFIKLVRILGRLQMPTVQGRR